MKNSLTSFAIKSLLLTCLLLTLPHAGQAQDVSEPVFEDEVTIDFGETITFSLSVEAPVEVLRAALFLRISEASQYQAFIADVIPGARVSASIEFQVQSINLLPFAQFEYFWQVDFSDGSSTNTEPATRHYLDTRFDWQRLTRERLTIYWVDGDLNWAQDLHSIAAEALSGAGKLLSVAASNERRIYVYPDQAALQNSLRQAGINQASAHALPEFGVALVAGESGPETLIRLEQEIPHELVHLLLYERMGPSTDELPVWLNEGLATMYEQSPRRLYTESLAQAAAQDELLPIESLCASFPMSENQRVLAYAQSASFTNYLVDIYGTGGIIQLLDAYAEGTTCTGGVQRVYQRSIDQLESEWHDSTFQRGSAFLQSDMLVLFITGASLIGLAVFIIWAYRRRKTGT